MTRIADRLTTNFQPLPRQDVQADSPVENGGGTGLLGAADVDASAANAT